jgi:hypothetical protein
MIEGLKPYAGMKDSGGPSLRYVPEHWSVSRIKNTFHEWSAAGHHRATTRAIGTETLSG